MPPNWNAIKAEADKLLDAANFDDIERPPPCRPHGDPKRHANYHRDYLRPDNPGHARHVPLDALLDAEAGIEGAPTVTVDKTPLWVSPLQLIEDALNRFPFASEKDRAIAQALYIGETWQHMTARLHISRKRVARVKRQIRDWARG